MLDFCQPRVFVVAAVATIVLSLLRLFGERMALASLRLTSWLVVGLASFSTACVVVVLSLALFDAAPVGARDVIAVVLASQIGRVVRGTKFNVGMVTAIGAMPSSVIDALSVASVCSVSICTVMLGCSSCVTVHLRLR